MGIWEKIGTLFLFLPHTCEKDQYHSHGFDKRLIKSIKVRFCLVDTESKAFYKTVARIYPTVVLR